MSDPRRVLSSGMHKILWWRQHVGQLLVGIYKPAHTHPGHPFVSRLFVPFPPRFSIVPLRGRTLFLSATFSLPLATADPEAGERAGRYVHFYALIYAHAYTKNNPVSKLKDNKRSAGWMLHPSSSTNLFPCPEPLHASFLLPCRSHYLLESPSSAVPKRERTYLVVIERINN